MIAEDEGGNVENLFTLPFKTPIKELIVMHRSQVPHISVASLARKLNVRLDEAFCAGCTSGGYGFNTCIYSMAKRFECS